jgi:uncharacterized membrane protein
MENTTTHKEEETIHVGTRLIVNKATTTAAIALAEADDDDNDEVFHPSVSQPNGVGSIKINKMPIGDEKHSIILNYYGILLALGSALFLALSGTFIKKARFLYASEQTFVRYLVQLLTMMLVMQHKKLNFLGDSDNKQRRLLAMRGIIGTVGLMCLHFSVKLIDPSDSVALFHTNVLIVAILSRFMLSEKLSIIQVAALMLTIVGVVFIAQPRMLADWLRSSMTTHSHIGKGNLSSFVLLDNSALLTTNESKSY